MTPATTGAPITQLYLAMPAIKFAKSGDKFLPDYSNGFVPLFIQSAFGHYCKFLADGLSKHEAWELLAKSGFIPVMSAKLIISETQKEIGVEAEPINQSMFKAFGASLNEENKNRIRATYDAERIVNDLAPALSNGIQHFRSEKNTDQLEDFKFEYECLITLGEFDFSETVEAVEAVEAVIPVTASTEPELATEAVQAQIAEIEATPVSEIQPIRKVYRIINGKAVLVQDIPAAEPVVEPIVETVAETVVELSSNEIAKAEIMAEAAAKRKEFDEFEELNEEDQQAPFISLESEDIAQVDEDVETSVETPVEPIIEPITETAAPIVEPVTIVETITVTPAMVASFFGANKPQVKERFADSAARSKGAVKSFETAAYKAMSRKTSESASTATGSTKSILTGYKTIPLSSDKRTPIWGITPSNQGFALLCGHIYKDYGRSQEICGGSAFVTKTIFGGNASVTALAYRHASNFEKDFQWPTTRMRLDGATVEVPMIAIIDKIGRFYQRGVEMPRLTNEISGWTNPILVENGNQESLDEKLSNKSLIHVGLWQDYEKTEYPATEFRSSYIKCEKRKLYEVFAYRK